MAPNDVFSFKKVMSANILMVTRSLVDFIKRSGCLTSSGADKVNTLRHLISLFLSFCLSSSKFSFDCSVFLIDSSQFLYT